MYIDLRKRGGDCIINSDFIVEMQPYGEKTHGHGVKLTLATGESMTVAFKTETDKDQFVGLIAPQLW